jgi:hypothetical protein
MTTELLHRDWILLRRDLILHRRALLPSVLIFAAFQVYFVMVVNQATLWLIFTCIWMTFITVVPLNREDKFGTREWSCTLPVSRADLMRGHYVTAWATVVGMFVVALALAALVPGSRLSVGMLLSPDRLLLAGGITTFILALLLPFTVRFGFMGVMMLLVVLQILGAAMFVVAKTTGNMDAVEGGIAAPFRALASGVVALRETLPLIAFQLAMLLVLILVNWASYRISLAHFRRRDL